MRYLSQPPVPPFRDVGAGDGDDWFLEDIVVPYHRFDPDLLPSRPAFAGRNLVGVAPQCNRCGLALDRYCQFLADARGVEPLDDLGLRLDRPRSEEHTSELQSLMRNSYAVFCLKKKKNK